MVAGCHRRDRDDVALYVARCAERSAPAVEAGAPRTRHGARTGRAARCSGLHQRRRRLRNCATQLSAGAATLLLVDDKREDAEEMCATVLGEELCRTPRLLRDRETGTVVWDNTECQNADDWDGCRSALVERYKFILGQADRVKEKGDCEEECDDHGCKSLAPGNRRVLGFGVRIPREEL